MIEAIKRNWKKIRGYTPWILAGLTLIFGNWASEAIYSTAKSVWYKDEVITTSWQAFTIVSFIGLIFLLKSFRNNFFPPRTKRLRKEPLEQRKHLVIFLSDYYLGHEKGDGIPVWFKPDWQLKNDINELERIKEKEPRNKWPWEMALRSIDGHLDLLKTITVICSEKSIKLLPKFVDICQKYTEIKNKRFYCLCLRNKKNTLLDIDTDLSPNAVEGYDFEDFDSLIDAFIILLKEFKQKKIFDKDVMVDITGGQKPSSVIGAVATFQNQLMFQYVKTNKPYDIVTYDVVQEISDVKGFRN